MSSESETDIDDDIFELACNYKLTDWQVKSCEVCQRNSAKLAVGSTELHPIPVVTTWHHVSIDFVGPISPISTSGNRYILTLSDQFSKWVEAVAVPTKEAHRVASALYKIFMRMGLPNVLTTDNGSEFRNKLNAAMLKKLGIRHSFITPYHPQSNGLDERYNQTLQSMLSKAVMGHKEMWDEFIDSAVFAYNTSTHESTTYSPFQVMFGRKARLPVEADLRPIPSNYDSRLAHAPNTSNQMAQVAKERQDILKDVKRNILAAQAKQKQHYDAKHTRAKLFDVGVQVFKKDFLRKKRKGGKLDPRWFGPYIITQKLSKGFYSLQSVANPSDCVKRVNGAHLKAFHSQEHMSNSQDLSQSSSPLSPRHSSQSTPSHSGHSSPHHLNQFPTFQSAFTHSLQSVYATAFQSVYTTAFQSVYTTAFQSVYTTAFQSVYTTAFQSVYTTAFQSTPLSQSTPQHSSQSTPQHSSQSTPQHSSQSTPQHSSQSTPQHSSQSTPQHSSQSTPQHSSQLSTINSSQSLPKSPHQSSSHLSKVISSTISSASGCPSNIIQVPLSCNDNK
ncbi:hypothetical protein EMCRGX_G003562 [Ephydatia muelleri]